MPALNQVIVSQENVVKLLGTPPTDDATDWLAKLFKLLKQSYSKASRNYKNKDADFIHVVLPEYFTTAKDSPILNRLSCAQVEKSLFSNGLNKWLKDNPKCVFVLPFFMEKRVTGKAEVAAELTAIDARFEAVKALNVGNRTGELEAARVKAAKDKGECSDAIVLLNKVVICHNGKVSIVFKKTPFTNSSGFGDTKLKCAVASSGATFKEIPAFYDPGNPGSKVALRYESETGVIETNCTYTICLEQKLIVESDTTTDLQFVIGDKIGLTDTNLAKGNIVLVQTAGVSSYFKNDVNITVYEASSSTKNPQRKVASHARDLVPFLHADPGYAKKSVAKRKVQRKGKGRKSCRAKRGREGEDAPAPAPVVVYEPSKADDKVINGYIETIRKFGLWLWDFDKARKAAKDVPPDELLKLSALQQKNRKATQAIAKDLFAPFLEQYANFPTLLESEFRGMTLDKILDASKDKGKGKRVAKLVLKSRDHQLLVAAMEQSVSDVIVCLCTCASPYDGAGDWVIMEPAFLAYRNFLQDNEKTFEGTDLLGKIEAVIWFYNNIGNLFEEAKTHAQYGFAFEASLPILNKYANDNPDLFISLLSVFTPLTTGVYNVIIVKNPGSKVHDPIIYDLYYPNLQAIMLLAEDVLKRVSKRTPAILKVAAIVRSFESEAKKALADYARELDLAANGPRRSARKRQRVTEEQAGAAVPSFSLSATRVVSSSPPVAGSLGGGAGAGAGALPIDDDALNGGLDQFNLFDEGSGEVLDAVYAADLVPSKAKQAKAAIAVPPMSQYAQKEAHVFRSAAASSQSQYAAKKAYTSAAAEGKDLNEGMF